MWFGYAMAWICTAAAVIVGMYYTHDTKVLWFLLLPALIRVSSGSDGEKDRDKKKEKETKSDG